MINNAIVDKTMDFAVRMVNLYKFLTTDKNEYILSKQILKSGTSIGANVSEAQYAESSSDFLSKSKIALKEAKETQYNSLNNDLNEIIKLLVSICKTVDNKIN